MAATPTGRNRFAAEVPATDDLHVRGRSLHAPGPALQHRLQQVPAVIGQQLQQGLVDCSQGYFSIRRRPTVGQLDLDLHPRITAHRVGLFIGLDAHIQLMRPRAHPDFGHAQPEGGFAQINQGGGCGVFAPLVPKGAPPFARCAVAPGEKAVPGHLAQAAAQGQYADIDIGAPALLHFHFDGRVLAPQLHHPAFHHALALDGYQCCSQTKRHADLKTGRLTGLVTFLLGQQINAVMVIATEPQFTVPGDIHRAGSLDLVTCSVGGGNNQLHFARIR